MHLGRGQFLNQSFVRLALIFVIASVVSSSAFAGKSKRQRTIDFDDEVVEGLNKRPLDSLSQISERDRKRHKPHLYHKRVGFRDETRETLHQLRLVP